MLLVVAGTRDFSDYELLKQDKKTSFYFLLSCFVITRRN